MNKGAKQPKPSNIPAHDSGLRKGGRAIGSTFLYQDPCLPPPSDKQRERMLDRLIELTGIDIDVVFVTFDRNTIY